MTPQEETELIYDRLMNQGGKFSDCQNDWEDLNHFLNTINSKNNMTNQNDLQKITSLLSQGYKVVAQDMNAEDFNQRWHVFQDKDLTKVVVVNQDAEVYALQG